eukprot:g2785.t1
MRRKSLQRRRPSLPGATTHTSETAASSVSHANNSSLGGRQRAATTGSPADIRNDDASTYLYLRERWLEEAARMKREAEDEMHRYADKEAEEVERGAEEEAEDEMQHYTDREAEEAGRGAEEEVKRVAEEEAERVVKENARREVEEEVRHMAEDRAKREAEQAKREKEEEAKHDAEERAKREAEKEAKRAAESNARREAEEETRRAAEEKFKLDAEEEARRVAEDEAKRADAVRAQRLAAARTRRESQIKMQREAEESALRRAEELAKRDAKWREGERMRQEEAREQEMQTAEQELEASRKVAEQAHRTVTALVEVEDEASELAELLDAVSANATKVENVCTSMLVSLGEAKRRAPKQARCQANVKSPADNGTTKSQLHAKGNVGTTNFGPIMSVQVKKVEIDQTVAESSTDGTQAMAEIDTVAEAASAPDRSRKHRVAEVWRDRLADRAQALLDLLEDEQKQQHRTLPRNSAWSEGHKAKNPPAPDLVIHSEELAMSRSIAETVAQGFKLVMNK